MPILYGGNDASGTITINSTSDATLGSIILNGGQRWKIGASAVNITLNNTAVVWLIVSNVTVTLPDAATFTGQIFCIKRVTTAGTVTVTRSGSNTIDLGTSIALSANMDWIWVQSSGSNWYIISRYYAL